MAKELKLDWVYCECGCHTSDLEIAGMRFSHLMRYPLDSVNKHVVLHEGSHLMGDRLGDFKDYKEHDKFLKKLLRQRLRLLQKALT